MNIEKTRKNEITLYLWSTPKEMLPLTKDTEKEKLLTAVELGKYWSEKCIEATDLTI